jgi:hypothetical protein
MQRIFIKNVACLRWEMFVAKSGSQLGGKRFADDEKFETEVRKWLRQQSRDFCAVGFDALVKQWTSVSMLVEYILRNKCFSRFEYHMFRVLNPFLAHLLTLRSILHCLR